MKTNKINRKQTRRDFLIYLAVSAFCAVFGAIYESFSFGVYSPYMVFAFALPLVLGAVPYFILTIKGGSCPDKLSATFYNSGVAALTVGSIMTGVLEIYGTTNSLMSIYVIAGCAFIFLGILLYLFDIASAKAAEN